MMSFVASLTDSHRFSTFGAPPRWWSAPYTACVTSRPQASK